jgi:hypothetical protein
MRGNAMLAADIADAFADGAAAAAAVTAIVAGARLPSALAAMRRLRTTAHLRGSGCPWLGGGAAGVRADGRACGAVRSATPHRRTTNDLVTEVLARNAARAGARRRAGGRRLR